MVANRETEKAFDVFKQCCSEMKFSDSCLAVGNMYLTGKGELLYLMNNHYMYTLYRSS